MIIQTIIEQASHVLNYAGTLSFQTVCVGVANNYI